ncbi:MAG: PD-(D/E)XK nuclease family protein [Candidatus Pacebacteria bacterium]|nr:PD-(D/E)XK nuclease family protein [Candidatus Paceibacterota bacterium]
MEIEAARLEEKGVRLMTSHSTKGLEYKTVILTNLAQGRFPIERYVGNALIPTELMPEIKDEVKILNDEEKDSFIREYEKYHQLLEERRLAYVSFTRAKDKLIMTFASEYGGKKVSHSCFLNEISYKDNSDVSFVEDKETKYIEPDAKSSFDANDLSKLLGSGNFDVLMSEMTKSVDRVKKENQKFSPSALLLFEECQKKFEYKYVYNMPESKSVSWDAMRLGSFVHLILEKGVSAGFSKIEEFLELAKETNMDEEWESVALIEAETLIKVFFERNKGKYNTESKTEQFLPLKIGGLDFIGFADRIDFTSQGAEIIDYKTGKSVIAPKDRNWQLGFYALAAQEKYGKVRKVILDMLKQERPLEFEIDDNGNAICVNSDRMGGFNIYEVEQELIMEAHKVLDAYKKGFKPCSIEKNCEFCNEFVHGL